LVKEKKSKVSIAHTESSDVLKGVRKAIEDIGGMSSYVKSGDVVHLKPNLVYPYPPPLTTDPRVIGAVAKLCFEAGAKRVLIGDSSAYSRKVGMGTGQWTNRWVMEQLGIFEVARDTGAEVVDFDEGEWVDVEIPDGVILRHVPIARSILDADVLINIPVMKSHLETLASLGLKNYHGIIPDFWKVQWHKDEISQKVVDIHKCVSTDLTVLDAIVAMEGLGPRLGGPVNMDLVFASSDVVALDAVAAEVMGYGADAIETTRLAASQGLGIGDLSKIEVIGEQIAQVHRNFRKPDLRIEGIYPGFTILKGGPCQHCYGRTKIFMEALIDSQLPDNAGIHTIVLGINPRQPELSEIEGDVAFLGDCAISTCANFRYALGPRAINVEGCPPICSVHKIIDQLKSKYT